MIVVEILIVVSLFLWFLSLLPPAASQFAWSTSWLAWISVVLIALFLFLPAMR
jgi:Fe2+ transport system protein B